MKDANEYAPVPTDVKSVREELMQLARREGLPRNPRDRALIGVILSKLEQLEVQSFGTGLPLGPGGLQLDAFDSEQWWFKELYRLVSKTPDPTGDLLRAMAVIRNLLATAKLTVVQYRVLEAQLFEARARLADSRTTVKVVVPQAARDDEHTGDAWSVGLLKHHGRIEKLETTTAEHSTLLEGQDQRIDDLSAQVRQLQERVHSLEHAATYTKQHTGLPQSF